MVQRDYLMRMIEQVTAVGAYVLRLPQAQRDEATLAVIDRTLREWLGFGLDTTDANTAEGLAALLRLTRPGQYGRTRANDELHALASLLHAEAEVYAALGDEDAHRRRAEKAVLLHLIVAREQSPPPPVTEEIDVLVRQLADGGVPGDMARELIGYYERVGRYADAEDWLFALLDAEGDADASAIGVAFYGRLLALSDEALEAGNLPHDEVEAGLAQVRAMR